MAKSGFQLRVELDGKSVTRLNRALKALGETDAPFIRAALDDIGPRFAGAIKSRAKGGIAAGVQTKGVKGSGGALRFAGVVKHPGSRSMEFGRQYYYRGYKGRAVKSGQRFKVAGGQRPQPYVGVINGDHAIGAVKGYARERLTEAINQEWERIGGPE